MSGGGLDGDLGGAGLYMIGDWARVLERENPMLSEMLRDLYTLLHAYDYALAGDTSMEDAGAEWGRFAEKWMHIDGKTMEGFMERRCAELCATIARGYAERRPWERG